MATERRPSRVASRIFRSLDDFATTTGIGEAYNDNVGDAVPESTSLAASRFRRTHRFSPARHRKMI